jgi:alpha-glucosidase (family GH31 glycosyl hydrolase)
MALVPYLAGLARHASEKGMPMWRGLALAYPEDASLWPILDEVLLGPGVLVAPIVTPGATSRDVVLPEGRWYPWEGGAAIAGGATILASATIEEIPVYAKAGAIVPMFPDGVMTLVNGSVEVPDATAVGDDREVRVFLGASGEVTEDVGLAYTVEATGEGTPAAWTWEGQALAACGAEPVAPCAEAGDGVVRAHVTGPGALEATGEKGTVARVTASGGGAARAIVWVVRY